jgi:hypothetical protein
MSKKRGVSSYSSTVEEEASVSHLNTRLVAQLVAQYGFCCLMDIEVFSKSLDKEFENWGRKMLYSKSTCVVSRSYTNPGYCFHRVAFGALVLKPEILKLLPKKWMHIYHVKVGRFTLEHPIQLASTTVTEENPLICYSQVAYIWDGNLLDSISRELDGRKYYVDHSRHTDEQYHFVVVMKNE